MSGARKTEEDQLIHARAPLRISFAGGGTDVPPFPALEGGAVLSTTIDLYAYASVRPKADGALRLQSPDLEASVALSGRERLARSVIENFRGQHPLEEYSHTVPLLAGADVTLHCDAPPGSGLGSSSSLIVAMVAALVSIEHRFFDPYRLAEQAWRIERHDLQIPGGMQDHYAASFGGFNFIEFGADTVLVNPLRIRPDDLAELHGSLLLVPTPTVARRSTGILERQIAAYERKDETVLAALSVLRQQAVDMKTSLLRGDFRAMGELLHQGWITKQQLAEGIVTEEIDQLYADACDLGATGGKLLGAGGGGFLLLMVPFDIRCTIARSLARRGNEPVNFSFTSHGVHAWPARA